MALELKVRNLQTGELGSVSFATEAEAVTWLRARPPFVDVLGAMSGVDDEMSLRLRASRRPYDDEEKAYLAKAEAEAMAEAKRLAEGEQKLAQAAAAERKK